MIPRGSLDIGYTDLLYGMGACLGLFTAFTPQPVWTDNPSALACLSVRTGFDLLLTTLNFPVGSEIIVSAVNIPDMFYLIEQHGLVAVAVSVNKNSLTVDLQDVKQAWTEKTRAVLFAHLYGAVADITALCEFAHQQGVMVLEDCAQAYQGNKYTGNAQAEVSMFSFGMIKTQTCLGGAVFYIRQPTLYQQMQALNATLPIQSRTEYLQKLIKACIIKFLSHKLTFTLVVNLCYILGIQYEEIMLAKLRGFSTGELLPKIRKQPTNALLMMLHYRLAHFDSKNILNRIQHVREYETSIPQSAKIGSHNTQHSYWVYPVSVNAVAECIATLRTNGIDATQRASSLISLNVDDSTGLTKNILQNIVFLPMYPYLSTVEKQKIVEIVQKYV